MKWVAWTPPQLIPESHAGRGGLRKAESLGCGLLGRGSNAVPSLPLQVFQRREDGSVNFFRGWEAYREGFGKLTGEHWLGKLLHSGDSILCRALACP